MAAGHFGPQPLSVLREPLIGPAGGVSATDSAVLGNGDQDIIQPKRTRRFTLSRDLRRIERCF